MAYRYKYASNKLKEKKSKRRRKRKSKGTGKMDEYGSLFDNSVYYQLAKKAIDDSFVASRVESSLRHKISSDKKYIANLRLYIKRMIGNCPSKKDLEKLFDKDKKGEKIVKITRHIDI